ncbi:MAG: hypothetical protein K2F72_05365, partial [Muribaculaceae bacterium]|nr:hypothetical protein [Muribaculaceae bacterium]
SAPYAGSWLYGWDIFSNAALTLTTAWLCMLARRPSCISAFIGGGLAAVATLCRVPDVLVLPAVLAVSVYSLPRRRAEAAAAVLAAFVIVVAGFILPVYGGIGSYINSIAVNALGGHSITALIQNTLSGMVWFSPLLCSSICLFLLVRHAGSLFGFRSWRFWSPSLAGATLLGLIFRLTVWKYTVVEQMAECIVITLL